jgi:hypothetical protein
MNLFKTPKIPEPTPVAAPLVPTIDQAAMNTDYTDKMRRRRGAAATKLVPEGAFQAAPVGSAQLLGQ